MTIAYTLFCPAYHFEATAFNPLHQPKNPLVKEFAARIVAIAAPILYLYQICLSAIISPIDLVLCISGISSGILFQNSTRNFFLSFINLTSSICEIPQKILFGPDCQANYFGDSERYKRIDYLSMIKIELI